MLRHKLSSLLLAVAILGCSPSQQFEETSSALGSFAYASYGVNPSWLFVVPADIQTENVAGVLSPCNTAAIVRISPTVDLSALMAAYASNNQFGSTIGLYIKSKTSVSNSAGVLKYSDEGALQNIFKADLTAGTSKTSLTVIASWDGLGIDADNALQTLPSGTYTIKTEVQLIKATVAGSGGAPVESLVGGGIVQGQVALGDPTSVCAAWKSAYSTLSGAGTGRVLVAGVATLERPAVEWRGTKPVSVFGNFATFVSGQRLDTLRSALWTYKALFSIPTQTTTSRIALVTETVSPTNTHLVARQYASGGYPLYGQRISADFDKDGRLVSISGQIFGNLEAYVPSFPLSQASAISAVKSDLQAKGLQVNRTIASLGQFVFRTTTGFDSVWVIGVDESPSELEGYRYVVSATSGAILEAQRLSSENISLESLQTDPTLVIDDNGNVGLGTSSPVVAVFSTRADPSDANGFPLTDLKAGGRVEHLIWSPGSFWPYWSNIDRAGTAARGVGVPVPTTVSASGMDAAAALRSRTTLHQMQTFFDFSSRFGPIGDELDVRIDYFTSTSQARGLTIEWPFGNDGIYLNSQNFSPTTQLFRDSAYYTAVHEFFHFFDGENVRLYRGPRSGNDGNRRMPFSLKEGLANVAKMIAEPYPVANYLGGGALLGCFLSGNLNPICWNDYTRIWRKPATTTAARQYGGLTIATTNVFPWLDCRSPAATSRCMLFRRPGAPGNSGQPSVFMWTGTPNDYNSIYMMAPQVLLDAWESASTNAAFATSNVEAQAISSIFPSAIMVAYTALEPDASYFEFERNLQSALTILALANGGVSPLALKTAQRGIVTAFERHGLDESLRRYCSMYNPDACH